MQNDVAIKHERVRNYLDMNRLDGVLLTRRCNFSWYTGGGLSYVNLAADAGVATLLVTRDEAVCLSTNIEEPRLRDEEVGRLGIECIGFAWEDDDAARRGFHEAIDGKTVAADVQLPAMPESVRALPPGFDQLRWSLTPGEVDRYRRLGREVAEAVEAVCRECQPGEAEYDVAARVTSGLWSRQIRPWVCLVAGDERITKYRHPIATEQPIARMAMVVACGERHGLICSITRIVSFGSQSDDLARRHAAVCRVDASMIDATRAGRTLGDVWRATVQAYADVGFPDEWRHHHQGGPTGYLTREARTTPDNASVIVDNQAFAWNPSIAGTKSEDTTLLTQQSCEVLTLTDQWPTLDVQMGARVYQRPDILVR